jgi:hypothetical protein
VFTVATTSLLSIRLYSRYQGRAGTLGLDDVLIVVAWALAVTTIGIIILCKCFGGRQNSAGFNLLGSAKYGFNKHIWDVQISVVPDALEVSLHSNLCESHSQYNSIAG